MKCPKIQSFSWSVFSCIRTEYGDLRSKISVFSPNTGKYGPEKTQYLDTFYAVNWTTNVIVNNIYLCKLLFQLINLDLNIIYFTQYLIFIVVALLCGNFTAESRLLWTKKHPLINFRKKLVKDHVMRKFSLHISVKLILYRTDRSHLIKRNTI